MNPAALSRRDRGRRIAWAATMACLLEASAEKPGNVTPTHDFHDTTYPDFLLSAVAIGPVLAQAAESRVGELVRQGVVETRQVVAANTNLGILLLFAPVARAYATAPTTDAAQLREAVSVVLAGLDLEDAREAYMAIRQAAPGGLGRAEHDVAEPPRLTLREAMATAAERDSIAREYVTGYALTFDVGLPALAAALADGLEPRQATLTCFLRLLAAQPDTLVARKLGTAAATALSRAAAGVLEQGGVSTLTGQHALSALTAYARDPLNQRNPGTTADLTAASLLCHLLLQGPAGLRGGSVCASSQWST
jgi:triphosphoribosyl-dephospho-CoA synthase